MNILGEEEKVLGGLTAKSIVIGIVFVAIGVIMSSLLTRVYLWMSAGVSPFIMWPTFLLVPLVALRRPLRLTDQELTVIFAMIVTAAFIPYITTWVGPHNWFYATSPYFPEDVAPFVPPYFYDFSAGLIYWTVYLLLNFLMVLSFLQIWRRQAVNIERLTFPVSQVPLTLITGKVKEESLFSKRGFQVAILVAFILSVIAQLPDTGWVSVPPDVEMFLGYITGGAYPVAPFPLMPSNILLYIGMTPFLYAIALLMPLDFLLTGFIMYLAIYVAYPSIAVPMGIMRPLVLAGENYSAGKYITIMHAFRPMAAFCWAGPIALGVAPFIINWGYAKRTLTGKEDDSAEVAPYRYLWIMTLVCFIALNAMMIATGVLASSAIIATLFALFGTLGLMYAMGMGAGLTLGWGGFNLWNSLITHQFTALPFYGNPDAAFTQTGFLTTSVAIIPYGDNMTMGAPFDAAMMSYKISDEVKAENRGLFAGQIVALVVATVLSMVFLEWLTMQYGWSAISGPGADYGVGVTKTGRYARGYNDDVSDQTLSMLAGFIIIVVVAYLRAVVPGFFLNPAAMIISGHNQAFGQSGMGIICLVSYIVKLVIFRTYGTDRYESKVIPILVGFIAGTAVGLGLMHVVVSAINLTLVPGLKWW